MDVEGDSFNVDWYFTGPSSPLIGHSRFASLNWCRPHVPPGLAGELPTAARPWRDGVIPSYIAPNTTGFILGTPGQYLNGAPGPLSAPRPIDYLGRDTAYTGYPPGIFPPFQAAEAGQSLVSSIYGAATVIFSTLTYTVWTWPSRTPVLQVTWEATAGGRWSCWGSPWALFGARGFPGPTSILGCFEYLPGSYSVWVDPAGGVLDPGEQLTINLGP